MTRFEALNYLVSTPLPSNEGRDYVGVVEGNVNSLFQHLYLLMKVVTSVVTSVLVTSCDVSTPLPSNEGRDRNRKWRQNLRKFRFNTFTF